jgi:tetratricopeptide (TPR) repeat protein
MADFAKHIFEMYQKAQSAMASEDYCAAEHLLKRVIRLERSDPVHRWWLGHIYYTAKQYRSAIASFKRAIRLQKDCTIAWLGLAETYFELKQWSKAAYAFSQMIDKHNLPFHNVLYAAVLIKLGEYARAKECCEKALEAEPGNHEAFYHLGDSLLNLGELGKAASALQQSIDLAPKSHSAHLLLGRIRYEDGRLEEAETCFRQASSLCDLDAETHYYLGKIALDGFDVKLGRAEFEYASEIATSDDSDVLVWAAEDICHYSHELAEQLFKRAIELDATNEHGTASYAEWLTYCGRVEEANQLLQAMPPDRSGFDN